VRAIARIFQEICLIQDANGSRPFSAPSLLPPVPTLPPAAATAATATPVPGVALLLPALFARRDINNRARASSRRALFYTLN